MRIEKSTLHYSSNDKGSFSFYATGCYSPTSHGGTAGFGVKLHWRERDQDP